MKKMKTGEDSVRNYYNRNTKRFLKFGQGGADNGIHRAVLAPGLTMSEAFRYQESLVLDYMTSMRPSHVIDLGCGTGSSLLFLNRFYRAEYTGITLSDLQAQMAEQNSHEFPHIRIIRGSYLSEDSYSSLSGEGTRLFFALESYLHAEDRMAFFRILARMCRPGDLVLIIDDFISEKIGPEDKALQEDFKKGWQAPHLISADMCRAYADSSGFELIKNSNLSPYLLMNRFRDRMIELMVPLLKPLGLSSSWWLNLLGGQALSRGSRKGLFQYRFLVFKRR